MTSRRHPSECGPNPDHVHDAGTSTRIPPVDSTPAISPIRSRLRLLARPAQILLLDMVMAPPASLAATSAGSEITLSHAAAVDFESGPGSMAASDVVLNVPLSGPVSLGDSCIMVPSMNLRSTTLSFEQIPTSVLDSTPRDLIVVPAAFRLTDSFLLRPDGSRWSHGLLASGKLASDLREITSEDFGFECEAFSAYQVSDCLSLGINFGMSLAENDKQFRPGICVDWWIHDDLALHLAGANWTLSYSSDPRCSFSLRGYTTNEIWSLLDQADETLTLKLGSYRIGCFYEQQLSENVSCSLGAGLTLDNRIRLNDMFGKTVVKAHLDHGPFVQLAFQIATW